MYSVSLNIAQVNLNSLVNKLNFVYNMLILYNIDFLGISETWLNDEIPNSFVALPNYNILRWDNKYGIRKHGVAFYIREVIKYSLVDCNYRM